MLWFLTSSHLVPKTTSLTSPYITDVTRWLDKESVSWREFQLPKEFPQFPQSNTILELGKDGDAIRIALHLIPTPLDQKDCLQPYLNKRLTDLCASSSLGYPAKVIHLHEDVWIAKTNIVRCRLLAQMGRSKRIFARKTTTRRVNATFAMDFLEEHHLWGPTKAKYYYGLFDSNQELVAVATFSSRRKIVRDGIPHRSHELLRFCAQRTASVIGGISKLIKGFIDEAQPDDIITVVDRDWGPGSGWHGIGFETVNVMSPIVMVVNPNEPGVRRQLVGAGINRDDNGGGGRLGLPTHILEELESINNDSIGCLSRQGFYPVYDSGVERLMKVVPKSDASLTRGEEFSAKELWRLSHPTYAPHYYSGISGISELLRHAEVEMPPLDSEEEVAQIASWRATGGTAASARLVFQAPSSLDAKATVEVRERADGWRTVGIVGGATKSIYHAVYKVDAAGSVDPQAMVSETFKCMAALVIAVLEQRQEETRFLHFGFGAGTLARFIEYIVPDSQHLAIELDSGVVAASELLSIQSRLHVEVRDALSYRRPPTQAPFDCICIDVFDCENLTPPEFYSSKFLKELLDNVLAPSGIVVHNFHSGGKKRTQILEEAEERYAGVFNTCCWVDSLDSKPNAGNSILLASKSSLEGEDIGKVLSKSALRAQEKWGVRFDAPSRVKGARRIMSLPNSKD
jgi:hypothetical protein